MWTYVYKFGAGLGAAAALSVLADALPVHALMIDDLAPTVLASGTLTNGTASVSSFSANNTSFDAFYSIPISPQGSRHYPGGQRGEEHPTGMTFTIASVGRRY
jgi:hypothetical protein